MCATWPGRRYSVLSMTYSVRSSRLAYAFGQIGSRNKRNLTRSMLLDTSDLPGDDWRLLGELMWRTGAFGKPSEIWRQAQSVGSFTGVRSFEQLLVSRWLLIKVAPVASVQDAQNVVPLLVQLSMPNPESKVTVATEGPVADVAVVGLDEPWAYEQLTLGMPDGPSSSRYVAGNIGQVAILVACSGYRDSWAWDEVGAISTALAEKVRSHIQGTD
jgi:hypothetical protein